MNTTKALAAAYSCHPAKPSHLWVALEVLLVGIGIGLGQPIITNQPQNQTNVVGTTATFTVGATGTEPMAYQWQYAFDAVN